MLLRMIPYLFFLPFSVFYMQAQNNGIPELGFRDFEKNLHSQSDSVYVINFWATWCGPCRKELPEFEKIHQAYRNQKIKVLLVSLDFPANAQKSLHSYLKSNEISAPVILLNEPDANSWIDKVDPSWSGALPATLIYKKTHRQFFQQELTFPEIEKTIQSFINRKT